MSRAIALVERADTLLLYGFALAASLLSVWIVIPIFQLTSFIRTTYAAILIGFALCYLLSRPAFPRRLVAWVIAGVAGAVALLLCVTAFISDYWRGGMLWVTYDQAVMTVLLWFIVALSYTLFTRNSLLFSMVAPLAIYGLIACNLISAQVTWGFLGILFAAFQVAGLDYYVSRREAAGARAGRGLSGHLLLVTAMFVLLVIVGDVITLSIRFVGSLYRLPVDTTAGATRPMAGISRSQGSFLDWGYHFNVATGPARLSPDVVLRLRSPEPLYLRARVYNQFGGSSWTASGPPDQGVTPFAQFVRAARPVSKSRTVRYAIELQQASSLVPHAARVVELTDWVRPGHPGAPLVSADLVGALRTTPALDKGTRYRATSVIRDYDPSQRRTTPLEAGDVASGALGYPNTSQPAVDMARRLTQNVPTLEQKVRTLAGWVGTHADYSTQADSYPIGADVPAYFVEHGGQAYCDVFATVFTIMVRGLGIPARLVTGYRADSLDPQEKVYIVRGTDAHAWTEVYLPGQGWVIVDATPAPSTAIAIPSLWERLFGSAVALRNLGLMVGLLALFALAILVAVRSGRLRLPGMEPRMRLPAGPRGLIWGYYHQACRLLARRGIARQPAQTPAEYFSRIAGLAPGLGLEAALPPLGSLTDQFHQARYSPHVPTPDEIEAARGEMDRLRRSLPRRKKNRRAR